MIRRQLKCIYPSSRNILLGGEPFDKADIGTFVACHLHSLNAFFISMLLQCVRSGDEHKVRLHTHTRCMSCADARNVLLPANDLLTAKMPASFHEYLVLEMGTCYTSSDVLLNGAGSHDRTSITRIHVSNERRAKWVKIGDHLGVLAHLMELGNCQVRLPETRCGCTSSSLRSLLEPPLVFCSKRVDNSPCTKHRSLPQGLCEQRDHQTLQGIQ